MAAVPAPVTVVGAAVGIGGSVALLLLAAKAHGRQLRLERELEGHTQVDFRGGNHPWVEALWRGDRVRFWTMVPIASAALALYAYRARAMGGAPVDFGAALPPWGAALVAALLWGPTLGFFVNGALSLIRWFRALREAPGDATRRTREARERPGWLTSAARRTVLWWTAAATACAWVAAAAFGRVAL